MTFINDDACVIPVDWTAAPGPGTPCGLTLLITKPSVSVGGVPCGLTLLLTQTLPVGDNPLLLFPAPNPPTSGSTLKWVRILGYQLSSQQSGRVFLKDGAGIVQETITFPGVAILNPDVNFGPACTPGQGLFLDSDTMNLRVTGHVVVRHEMIWRRRTLGSPVGLTLALTNP